MTQKRPLVSLLGVSGKHLFGLSSFFSQPSNPSKICPTGAGHQLLSSLTRKNISLFRNSDLPYGELIPPRFSEGRIAVVTTRWARDAMDVDGATDECAGCGRQSRGVLIPRRWYQAGRNARALRRRRRQSSPVSGETSKETVKTIRAGSAGFETGEPVVTTLVCLSCFACEAAGASDVRHSLRPL